MWKPGLGELLIVLLIVVLVFGVGRLPTIGKDLGSAIRNFRKGLQGDEEGEKNKPEVEEEKKS